MNATPDEKVRLICKLPPGIKQQQAHRATKAVQPATFRTKAFQKTFAKLTIKTIKTVLIFSFFAHLVLLFLSRCSLEKS